MFYPLYFEQNYVVIYTHQGRCTMAVAEDKEYEKELEEKRHNIMMVCIFGKNVDKEILVKLTIEDWFEILRDADDWDNEQKQLALEKIIELSEPSDEWLNFSQTSKYLPKNDKFPTLSMEKAKELVGILYVWFWIYNNSSQESAWREKSIEEIPKTKEALKKLLGM